MTPAAACKRIAMLAFPDVQMLDVTGPLEVFARSSRWLRDHGKHRGPAYSVEIIGLEPGPFAASSGLRLYADHGIGKVPAGIDTLLVAGGLGVQHCRRHPALMRWLRAQARRVRRMGSVCTGAFLLADAGLLDGHQATTHWDYCASFAREFPGVMLQPDTIFVKQGSLYTSGGVTAGMDLALALVEEDHGKEAALAVARELVMFVKRPGGQAQFSAQLSVQMAQNEPLRDLQAYIIEHPEADLSVQALAGQVAMSPRNFARVFSQEVGMTPARFVSSVRVETARRLLETGDDSIAQVCEKSGLGTIESMRRAFSKAIGVPPGQYRERFNRF